MIQFQASSYQCPYQHSRYLRIYQDVNRVLSFVLEVIHRFLSRNGFATVLPKPTEAEAAYIERARPPHKRVRYDKLGSNSSNVQGALLNLETYRGLACSDAKLPQSYSNHHIGAKDTLIQRDDSGYFGWAGPPTGESLSIDSQTGNSLPKHRILDQTQADRSTSINGSPRGLPTPSLGHCSLERASSDALGAHSVTAAFPTWLAKVMKVGYINISSVSTIPYIFVSAMAPLLLRNQVYSLRDQPAQAADWIITDQGPVRIYGPRWK
jgi:hypothetical protein